MDNEKKIAFIKEVKEKHSLSLRKLDPKGKGKYAGKIIKGEHVTDHQIETIYQNALELAKGKKVTQTKTTKRQPAEKVRQIKTNSLPVPTTTNTKELDNLVRQLERRLEILEKKNKELIKEIQDLKDELSEEQLVTQKGRQSKPRLDLSENLGKERLSKSPKILGFSIQKKKTSTKGRVYQKWYAVKRINGKQVWI